MLVLENVCFSIAQITNVLKILSFCCSSYLNNTMSSLLNTFCTTFLIVFKDRLVEVNTATYLIWKLQIATWKFTSNQARFCCHLSKTCKMIFLRKKKKTLSLNCCESVFQHLFPLFSISKYLTTNKHCSDTEYQKKKPLFFFFKQTSQ